MCVSGWDVRSVGTESATRALLVGAWLQRFSQLLSYSMWCVSVACTDVLQYTRGTHGRFVIRVGVRRTYLDVATVSIALLAADAQPLVAIVGRVECKGASYGLVAMLHLLACDPHLVGHVRDAACKDTRGRRDLDLASGARNATWGGGELDKRKD